MTVDGDRIKDSFLETVKNPIKETFKKLQLDFTAAGNQRTSKIIDHLTGFKPVTLKMDTCFGLEDMLGKDMVLKLYNKKTQAIAFTLEGFPQVIDYPARTVRFFVRTARVGL